MPRGVRYNSKASIAFLLSYGFVPYLNPYDHLELAEPQKVVELFDWRSGRQKSGEEAEEEEIQALMSQVGLRIESILKTSLMGSRYGRSRCVNISAQAWTRV